MVFVHFAQKFTCVDPLTEKYYSVSPYVYALNNPIRFIDPDGREVGLPEVIKWANDYRKGAWGAAAGLVFGVVSANPVSSVQSAAGEAGKVIDAYQTGGVEAAASQYATSLYETSGAQTMVENAKGIINGDPQAIGAAATIVVGVALIHEVGKTGGVKAETGNVTINNGTIYEVPGDATSSGKSYIGRHNKSTPESTRKSNDGRDRTKAKVIDRYDASDPKQGQYKEQKAIDAHGGVKNLDNKRNEVNPKRVEELKKKYGNK